jgi:mono/diheme cytochrome c family protein
MRRVKFVAVAIALPLAWAGGVPELKVTAADEPPPSFSRDVKPFLTNYCQNCHSGRRAKGGYSVETYANLFKRGKKGGPMVVAGKPDESRLLMTLAGRAKRMPPRDSDQPTADEVAKVKAWIAAGARDDGPGGDKKSNGN